LPSSKWSNREIQPNYTQARPYLKHNWKRLAKISTNDAAKLPYNTSSIHRKTPAMMLMHRELRTKLPNVKSSQSYDDTRTKQPDAKAKKQAKEYADGKRRAREKKFKIGDKVLLRHAAAYENIINTIFQRFLYHHKD
jgi:hypothetical protein